MNHPDYSNVIALPLRERDVFDCLPHGSVTDPTPEELADAADTFRRRYDARVDAERLNMLAKEQQDAPGCIPFHSHPASSHRHA